MERRQSRIGNLINSQQYYLLSESICKSSCQVTFHLRETRSSDTADACWATFLCNAILRAASNSTLILGPFN